MFALASFLQPELQYPPVSEDFFWLVLILLCLVVRTESEGGGRELGVWASIGQDHHLPRQEPGEAGQEHQLQEQSLGEISGSNCHPGLRNKLTRSTIIKKILRTLQKFIFMLSFDLIKREVVINMLFI